VTDRQTDLWPSGCLAGERRDGVKTSWQRRRPVTGRSTDRMMSWPAASSLREKLHSDQQTHLNTIPHYDAAFITMPHTSLKRIYYSYNPLGNLNSGRSPGAKLVRSASLQLVFDAAITKLLWRLVSRCFYMAIRVFVYDKVEVTRTIRMRCNVTKSLSTVIRWRYGNCFKYYVGCFQNIR